VQGKVYFGITRLASIFWGVSSDTTHILFNLKIKKKSDQLSKILSPSFEIIDALGISQSSYFKPQLTFGYTGPPTNNYITNKTITNGQNYCYDALQTITIAGNGTTFKLMNGGMVNLIAGQKIIFLPGTLVQSGGQLKAWITTNGGYCNSLYNKSTLPPLPGDSLGGYSTDKGFFIVYPNPSTGNIWLKLLNENLPCDVELYLYNFIGKKLEQRKLTISSTVQISLNSLNPGIYFVRMVKGELTGVAKIVKL